MTLKENEARVVAGLSMFNNPQERLAQIVSRARALPPLADDLKTDDRRVTGCLAKLWLVAEFRDGRCWFRCDSDSLITKGIAALLCDFYSGAEPVEIIAHEPEFLREFGITQHLTPNRRNGLSQLRQRIRAFAEQHAAIPVPPT